MSKLWNDVHGRFLAEARPESWADYLDSLDYVQPLPRCELGMLVDVDSDGGVTISDSKRWQVWERDDFRCQECGSRRFLSVDHIYAHSRGGPAHLKNLRTLCRSCNSRKHKHLIHRRPN